MKTEGKLKKIIGFTLKLLIAGGIVAFLVHRNRQGICNCFQHFDYRYLIPAIFFYMAHLVVCAWRWRELAGILGVRLSRMEALSLTFQGCFFSLVIPAGAIGGDIVKMGAISRRSAAGTKVEGAFTVLMDRIIGMIALFALELAIIVPAIPILMNVSIAGMQLGDHTRKLGIWLLVLLAVAGLLASSAIFFHRIIERIPLLGMLMNKADALTHGTVGRMTDATDVYSGSWKKLSLLTLASIPLVHLMTVVPMLFLLSGLGAEYRVFDVVVAVTIGNIIGLIPIFPSGIGGRDIAFTALLAASGTPESAADTAQLLYTGILVLSTLPGMIFFLADPGRKLQNGDVPNRKEPMHHE